MFIAIILAWFWNLTSCSSPSPVHTNVSGVEVTEQDQEFEIYLTKLDKLISNPETMVTTYDIVLPPKFDLNSIVKEDTLSSGNLNTVILLSNGKTLSFKDSINIDREDGNLERWSVRAYDINNNVLYMMKNESYGFFRFFGISLNTGNEFTVYNGNPADDNDWMYEYKFSPEMKYLAKAGDLDNKEYGWSVVDLSNGIESKKLYEHYVEFISEPWWKKNNEFRICYTRIPYVYGLEYKDDYKFYLSLKSGEAVRWSMFSTYELIDKEQIFNLKGNMISEKVLKTIKIEIK